MKRCPGCGKIYDDNKTFCGACGRRLEEYVEQTAEGNQVKTISEPVKEELIPNKELEQKLIDFDFGSSVWGFKFDFGSAQQLVSFVAELKKEYCFPELTQAYDICVNGVANDKMNVVAHKGDRYIIQYMRDEWSGTTDFGIDLSGKFYGNSIYARHWPDSKIVNVFPEILKKVAKEYPFVAFSGEINDTDGDWYQTNEEFSYADGILKIRCSGYSDAGYTALDIVEPFLTNEVLFTKDDFEPKDFTGDRFELSPEAKEFFAECLKKRHIKIDREWYNEERHRLYFTVMGNDEDIDITRD